MMITKARPPPHLRIHLNACSMASGLSGPEVWKPTREPKSSSCQAAGHRSHATQAAQLYCDAGHMQAHVRLA